MTDYSRRTDQQLDAIRQRHARACEQLYFRWRHARHLTASDRIVDPEQRRLAARRIARHCWVILATASIVDKRGGVVWDRNNAAWWAVNVLREVTGSNVTTQRGGR